MLKIMLVSLFAAHVASSPIPELDIRSQSEPSSETSDYYTPYITDTVEHGDTYFVVTCQANKVSFVSWLVDGEDVRRLRTEGFTENSTLFNATLHSYLRIPRKHFHCGMALQCCGDGTTCSEKLQSGKINMSMCTCTQYTHMNFQGKLLEGCEEQDGELLKDSALGGFASVATTTLIAVLAALYIMYM